VLFRKRAMLRLSSSPKKKSPVNPDLAAGIQVIVFEPHRYSAVGTGAADDGGIDVDRAIVPTGDAGGDLLFGRFIYRYRADARLALELADIFQVRRAAG